MLIVQKKIKSKYENFNKCNICHSRKLKQVFSMGKHTPADTFVSKKKINLLIDEVDLDCFFCKKCLNIQLKKTLNQNIKYNRLDYSYSSSNSKKSRSYLDEYYLLIKKYFKKNSGKILEIGANDGYLIKKFRSKFNLLYSCEASKFWSRKLIRENIVSINNIFEKIPKLFKKKHKESFDIIIANNVFNHSHNARKFFKNLKFLINKDGLIFIEVPYSKWMIEKKKFELVYLEHINYYNLNTFKKLCEDSGLKINKIFFKNYHGKMIRIMISKKNTKFSYNNLLAKEKFYFKNLNKFKEFKKNIKIRKNRFLKKIKNLRKKNNQIVAIGASAKTSSLLNFFNLDNQDISFITDNAPQKVGKFIPNKKIPIKSDEALSNIKNAYVFFSTWNISDFVKKKIIKINKSIKIIKY
tara:strand:- start:6872 stop:8101 length:1230 start_codon:yes stop_codon:yes gene_type:complete